MPDHSGVEILTETGLGGLHLLLLGPPEIIKDSKPITISRKQVRLLLYYLAACDQFVSYEHLRFLFWPNKVDAVSQHYLARLLNHLEASLGKPGILLRNETHIQLDRRQYWSDLRIFRGLNTQPGNGTADQNQLEVIQLYRGPFLEGVQLDTYQEFENIIEKLRTGLEQKYLNLLEGVITRQAEAGELECAIELCHRYLQMDDLDENIHRMLMRLYTRTGKRKLAIQQYHTCNEVLHENLGIKPMLETKDLYQSVLEGRFEQLNNYSAGPMRVFVDPPAFPFLGRVEILEKFNQAVTKASQDQGNVLLINGASGKGKTRLLREFERQVDPQSLCVLVNCHPGTGTVRYYPLLKILRYIQNLDPNIVRLDRAILAEAKEITREINDQVALIPAVGLEAGTALTFDLWERTTDFFLRLARRSHPLILLIDDLHLADASSQDWLSYFCGQIKDQPCLLVSSYCCKEVGQLGNFRAQLLSMGPAYQECHLEGLIKSAVYQAVKMTFGNVKGCRLLSDRLWEITAGNPLYLQEILRGIVESGYLPQELLQKEEWPLPDNVWKAVEIGLERLKPLPRKIIENAAYMEPVFYFEQLASLLQEPEMDILDALDDLLCRNFLVDCEPGYRFQHPLIRVALRRTTSKTRQVLIERRLRRMNAHLIAESAGE